MRFPVIRGFRTDEERPAIEGIGILRGGGAELIDESRSGAVESAGMESAGTGGKSPPVEGATEGEEGSAPFGDGEETTREVHLLAHEGPIDIGEVDPLHEMTVAARQLSITRIGDAIVGHGTEVKFSLVGDRRAPITGMPNAGIDRCGVTGRGGIADKQVPAWN